MSIAEQPKPGTVVIDVNRKVSFVPLGSKVNVDLTVKMVRDFLCTPTRSGAFPSDADIVKFMMLCKARELDPWVSDAYLVGYDSQNGPVFNLITSAQALMKRAEISPEYDGMESGVVIKKNDGVEYREGDLVLDGETLVGGWARCFRRDRSRPSFDALKLSTYTTGKSRWASDPAGMIVKCAESSVLRKSFPTQLGGLYTREEMDHLSQARIDNRESGTVASSLKTASNLDELAARMELPSPPADDAKRVESQEPTKQIETQNGNADPNADPLMPWDVRVGDAETIEALEAILADVDKSSLTAAQMTEVAGWVMKKRSALKKK